MCKLIGKYSSSAHELLLQFLLGCSRSVLRLLLLDEVLLDRRRGQPSLDLEGPGERAAADGKLEALGCGVQVRPPTGCPSRRIGEDLAARAPVTGDDSQQLALRGPLPTPDARADTALDGTVGHASAQAFVMRVADRRTV